MSRACGFGGSSMARIPSEYPPSSPRLSLPLAAGGNGAQQIGGIRGPRKLFCGVNGVDSGRRSVDPFFNALPVHRAWPATQADGCRPRVDLTSYAEKPLIPSPTNLTPNTRKRTERMAALF